MHFVSLNENERANGTNVQYNINCIIRDDDGRWLMIVSITPRIGVEKKTCTYGAKRMRIQKLFIAIDQIHCSLNSIEMVGRRTCEGRYEIYGVTHTQLDIALSLKDRVQSKKSKKNGLCHTEHNV